MEPALISQSSTSRSLRGILGVPYWWVSAAAAGVCVCVITFVPHTVLRLQLTCFGSSA